MRETSTESNPKLELLAIRCQLGEPAAIDELVERWHSPLWHYIRRLLGDDGLAEEVHQDVWLRILRSLDRLREPAKLAPWLFSIARRAAMDHLRHRYGEAGFIQIEDESFVETEYSEIDFDEIEILQGAIEDLPLVERETLTLFYLRELGLSDVATVLEIPIGTVKSRLHRARRLLRKRLEEKGVTR
ncbi:MAG TPA: sigma-70 family RNA polymerase sigma factor [Thermoanaerobaculia bacterium]|nr:sigma-70 family RNA polymerase sigma factor [Thermoanaerobaculia bacterium]